MSMVPSNAYSRGKGQEGWFFIRLGNKIMSVILARHVNATTIICINDPYVYAESIKDDECDLHIQGQGPIPNVYIS